MKELQSSLSYPVDLKKLKESLPGSPGIYIFRDKDLKPIYVGKAKNIRKRVLSYMRSEKALAVRTSLMMSKALWVDIVITDSENEAFLLESTLIRRYMPRYNVILRDDKRYPSLRLDSSEAFPGLRIVRKIKKDGAVYFGPFSSVQSMRETMRFIEKVFMLRTCKGDKPPVRQRPCINYQMGRCLGPCAVDVSPEDYSCAVEQVRLFFEGKNREIIKNLESEMKKSVETLDFEQASLFRDRIIAIENVVGKQHVLSSSGENIDAAGMFRKDRFTSVSLLTVRNGAVTGCRNYDLDGGENAAPSEIMEAFISQYYAGEEYVPPEILISDGIENTKSLEQWLSPSGKVRVIRPGRGKKRKLVEMAVSNAEQLVGKRISEGYFGLPKLMKDVLGLPVEPYYVEGLDISNLSGDKAVGSVVSFVNGKPHKEGYRSFRLKSVDGIDDYAMMKEIAGRRMTCEPLPDLFIVDGGYGHLNAVLSVTDGYENAPFIISIAKADSERGETADKIYIQGSARPVILPDGSPVLHAIMRIRDEAHRRAVSHHRTVRQKNIRKSVLDEVRGIGAVRKKALLKKFGSVKNIKNSSPAEIASVSGMTARLAEEVFARLNGI